MKYKNRLVAFVISIFTFSVLYVITQEPKSGPDTSREVSRTYRPMRRFGYLQDKLQEAVGIRKVVKRTEMRLKDANEIRERLKLDKTDHEATINNNVNQNERKSESGQAFENAILRKFKRTYDNRKIPELNG